MYCTSSDYETKADITAMIQHLGSKHLGSAVDDRTVLLPPPLEKLATGEFLLGGIWYGKKHICPVGLSREDLMKHVGIFAITGAGKTTIALNLLSQLTRKRVPFLVVDWKRSYRVLQHEPGCSHIRVLSVGRESKDTLEWNPLRPPPGVHPQTWLSVVAEALEKSHISGQGVADVFLELFDEQFENFGAYDGTLLEYPTFFDAKAAIERKKFSGRRGLWQDSCKRILRTFTFGPAAKSFNERNPMKLEDLLSKPVIFELDQELPKPLRVFFSDIVLRWIHLYRLGLGESSTLQHVMVLEEAHNLFPKSSIEHQATNSLETIYREIRSFGEGLVCITQHPSLLPVYILGNCNTQIYLGLQHEDDIRTARSALYLDYDDAKFLDYLKVGEGIVKIKGRVEPCFVRFPPLRRVP
jgi:hypothetical protein